MADGQQPALGLSVGATNLAAVTADRTVTRRPVLTLYRQRPPEVGVPSENPKLDEPGLVITDFVHRVGDPGGVAAADNTTHRPETLIADALRALAYTATDGRPLPDAVAVTHPAHWDPAAVNSVRVALGRVSEWSGDRLILLPDSTAALFALNSKPGVPGSGIIAVCDFGGSGTTLSLLDAAHGYQPITQPSRYTEFSGSRIDQALLSHVIGDLSPGGSSDTSATSAIGSLTQLRTACRYSKERLSSQNENELTTAVPGYRGEIRLTRGDLDDTIRRPLDGFVAFFHDVLRLNDIRPSGLAAVALVGGGAAIPLVTRTLSERSGAPVITAQRPQLTAAVGAALRAATAVGSVSDATIISQLPVEPAQAPAWSEAVDSGIMPIRAGEYDEPPDGVRPTALERGRVDLADQPAELPTTGAWYRRPVVVAVGRALVVLAIGAGVMITLRHASGSAPSAPTVIVSPTSAPSPSTSPGITSSATPSNPPSTTDSQASTTTESPGRSRFPQLPGDRPFPSPGQGGR